MYDFEELSEAAQSHAIAVIRDRLAGPWWDVDDIKAVYAVIVHALAQTLGTVGASASGTLEFAVISGVRVDGWNLDYQHSVAVSGILDRDNAAGLPWVDGLDHVELTSHRLDFTTVTVHDAAADCTCSSDHSLLPRDADCSSLASGPATDEQRDALCAAWTAGAREGERRTGEVWARESATNYLFTQDGE